MTIFAYGQTSTGKTFTMRGISPHNEGVIPLSIKEIFSLIEGNDMKSCIKVSYVEIYNEAINDLLDNSKKNLDIREGLNKEVFVNNLTEVKVCNSNDVMSLLKKGEDNRIVAETKLNEKSSRSHSVFRINIEITKKIEQNNTTFISQLNLIDLAGSENASKTCCVGLRFKEGANINKSLLALSNVINSLSQRQFVNYRDSKLTRLLQPALGGNSKTAIICTITDDAAHYSETMNTLHFGLKAKNVKTFVKVNEVRDQNKFQIENEKLKNKVRELEYFIKTQQKIAISNDNLTITNHKVEFSISKLQNEYCVKENNNNNELSNNKNESNESSIDKRKTKNVLNTLEKEITLLRSYLMKQKGKEKQKEEEDYKTETNNEEENEESNEDDDSSSIESEAICRNLMMSSRKPNFKIGLNSAKENKYQQLLMENEEMKYNLTSQENQFREVIKNKDNNINLLQKNQEISLKNYSKMLKESEENYNILICKYDKAQKELEDKKEQFNQLHQQNINCQADLNNLKDKISFLEQQKGNELLLELLNENDNLKQENELLKESITNKDNLYNELKTQNDNLIESNENLIKKCENLNNELMSCKAQIEFINKVHSLLKIDNSKLKHEIESYKDEVNRLKAKKVKVNNNKENIQTENNKIEINKEFLSKKRKITYTNTSCVFKQKIKN